VAGDIGAQMTKAESSGISGRLGGTKQVFVFPGFLSTIGRGVVGLTVPQAYL
jgi:hypothetical protein